MLGNLFPQREQARQVLVRGMEDFLVMMNIDDDSEVVAESLLNGPVDSLEKGGIDGVRRLLEGMGRPADRQTNRRETCLPDEREIVGFKLDAPLPFARRFQGVANVDTATQNSIEANCIRLGICRG